MNEFLCLIIGLFNNEHHFIINEFSKSFIFHILINKLRFLVINLNLLKNMK